MTEMPVNAFVLLWEAIKARILSWAHRPANDNAPAQPVPEARKRDLR